MKVNWLLALGIVVGTAADADSATSALVLESDYVHYEIGADARNLRLFDTQTGTEYLKDPGVSVAAYVHKDGTDFPATRLERDSAGYVLEFESAGARAVLRPVRHPHFLTIEVVSVEGERVDALTFLNADLVCRVRSCPQPENPRERNPRAEQPSASYVLSSVRIRGSEGRPDRLSAKRVAHHHERGRPVFTRIAPVH